MSGKNKATGRVCLAAASAILAALIGLTAVASEPPARGDLDQILQDLENFAQTVWDPQKVPGMAYAVVRGSETVYARGFGRRSQNPSSGFVDEHTLFEIGSTTKAFNAAVLGTVVDEGKIAWSDRVRDHLPDFKMYDRWVTKEMLVEDLLAQRSGMPGYSLDMMPMVGFDRAAIRHAMRFVEPVTSFRSSYAYQNCMHLWAAELIEKKTGLAWEEAVRQRILDPLGMSESTFAFAVYDANPNHALGHMATDDGLQTIPSDWPYRSWMLASGPAGGLCSSVSDMTKWIALQLGKGTLGGRVYLKPETFQAIRAPRIFVRADATTGVVSYASGWVFHSSPVTPWYWHDGSTSGMHSIVAIYPEADVGLVVLTNAKENRVPECLAFKLLELLFGAAPPPCGQQGLADFFPARRGQLSPAPEEAVPTAAIPLNKLVGTYENPAYGKVVVKKAGGGLTMVIGPARRTGPLSPLGGNKFQYHWDDWPSNRTTIVFKADSAGNVTKLTMLELGDVRGGDFERLAP